MLSLYAPVFSPLTDEASQNIIEETGEEIVIGRGGQYIPLDIDDYYRIEKVSGLDEIWFVIKQSNPAYTSIQELSTLVDEDGRIYLVRKIDAGANDATVCAQLDMEDWKGRLLIDYTNGSNTALNTLMAVAPAGWTFINQAGIIGRRTVSGTYTPFDILMACLDVYGMYIRIDNSTRVITLYRQAPGNPSGAFATRQLNLRQINYKGTAEHETFATRLYAFGKEGLTFADINGGMPYVDNFDYSTRVVCAVWSDERYTDKQSLLEDAQRKIDAMSVPARSYECDVIDLKAVDPDKYNFLDFGLLTVATLVDDVRGTAINYQVIERTVYPHYPERNKVVFSDVPVSIQHQMVQIRDAIANPNSTFRQGQQALIDNATNWLTSSDGHVIAVQAADGSWKELLFLDTDSAETAKNVLRINNNGIGFSTSGVNGPYANAWTIDGNLIADFITAGSMSADRIHGGTLELGGIDNGSGSLIVYDETGRVIGRWDKDGIYASAGSFSGTINVADGAFSVDGYGRMSARNATIDGGTIHLTDTGSGIASIHVESEDYGESCSIYSDMVQIFGPSVFDDGAHESAKSIGMYHSNGMTLGSYTATDGECDLYAEPGGFFVRQKKLCVPMGYSTGTSDGITGTYTLGSRTVKIEGGIITSVI